jgi:hypothetical protein
MNHKICPICRSHDTRVSLSGELPQPGVALRAYKNRICNQCQTGWQPRAPLWLGILLTTLPILIIGAEVYADKQMSEIGATIGKPPSPPSSHFGYWFLAVIAIQGLLITLGIAGKMKILRASPNPSPR